MEIKKVNHSSGGPKQVPPGQAKKQHPSPPPVPPPVTTPPQTQPPSTGAPPPSPPSTPSQQTKWVNNYYTFNTTFNTTYDSRSWVNEKNVNLLFGQDLDGILGLIRDQWRSQMFSYGLWSLLQRPYWGITHNTPYWGSAWYYDNNRSPYSVTPPAMINLYV